MNWRNIKQTAEYLNCSVEKLYKLCERNKKFPAYKFGGAWYFDFKEIDNWIKKGGKRK